MKNTSTRGPSQFARSSSRAGMGLVETMVWLSVLSLIMFALASTLISFYHTNSYAIKEASATVSAEHGIDVAVRALRTASYSSSGAYPIVSIGANQITFYAHVTPNDPQIQRVRLFVATTTLYEGIIEPSGDPASYANPETVSDIADYVQNITAGTSTFVYFDSNGDQISNYAQYANVRFVSVNLVVDASTTSLPTALMLRSSAALRNLVGN